MWVLESDGDLLAGKVIDNPLFQYHVLTFTGIKYWLKPGTQFLVGRTKNPGTRMSSYPPARAPVIIADESRWSLD